MIGSVLSHYRILSPLGAGGMGVVYLAEDQRLGRQVAIKFLPPDATKNPQALERFHLEARAVSSLSHPGICALYDIGLHEGSPFLVMERLRGETLRARILRGALPVADVIDIAIQLAEALEAAHAQGIVHRDIKPANIWIGEKQHAKILDFGLAKLAPQNALLGDAATDDNATVQAPRIDNPLTMPGMAIGTVLYMSPEQARGEVVDARTDIFSLGVVLYEMITGQQAFAGSTAAVVFDAILNRAPLPPMVLNPEIPVRLQDVITSTLEKDRDRRCQSAALLEGELRRIRREVRSSDRLGRPGGVAVAPDSDATFVPTAVTGPTAIVPPTAAPTIVAPSAAATPTVPLGVTPASASVAPTSGGTHSATVVLSAPAPRARMGTIAAAAAVVVVAAGGAWLVSERSGDGGTSATANLLQRAQAQLEVGDVRAALVEARAVLAQDAQHPEATRIALAAEAKLATLDAALARSRNALAVNDLATARTAFEAAQTIAPGDPVVASLADQLARTAGAPAAAPVPPATTAAITPSAPATPANRDAARRGGAGSPPSPGVAPATPARQPASPVPAASAAVSQPSATGPSSAQVPPPAAAVPPPEPRPLSEPPPAPVPARTEPANPTPAEPRPPAAEAAPVAARRAAVVERASDDDAVRHALQIYERAIENKDLALFKSVRPDLSGDEERRLRASFQQVDRQHVELQIDALAVTGDQAEVRVTRQDSVQSGGRTQTSRSTQTIRLARRGAAWIIVSLGR